MMYYLGSTSQNRMAGIDEKLIILANRAIEITKIDFGIPQYGGLRSIDDQYRLFIEDKSNADGYDKLSKHQSGKALDFYAYVDGKASWEKEYLSQIAAAFLQAAIELGIKIRWGGLFKSFLDMPHIELIED